MRSPGTPIAPSKRAIPSCHAEPNADPLPLLPGSPSRSRGTLQTPLRHSTPVNLFLPGRANTMADCLLILLLRDIAITTATARTSSLAIPCRRPPRQAPGPQSCRTDHRPSRGLRPVLRRRARTTTRRCCRSSGPSTRTVRSHDSPTHPPTTSPTRLRRLIHHGQNEQAPASSQRGSSARRSSTATGPPSTRTRCA